MLFNEVYSGYYLVVESILREAVRGTLTGKELAILVREYAFAESFPTLSEGLKGERWSLLRRDLTPAIVNEPSMPLTLLEKRWLKSLLTDPRIKLFEPDDSGLEDIEPLFTSDSLVYYDRYTDGDDYSSPEYIANFKTILQALRDNQNLSILFETRQHDALSLNVTPHYLEYSEKDDRFRLAASNSSSLWNINLSRILSCEPSDSDERFPIHDAIIDSVTFELIDRWNALERVLLHFSHLEKETKRLDGNRYSVTLRYNRHDEKEMVIRILSFGSTVRVTSPERFIELLRERIDRQMEFATFFP